MYDPFFNFKKVDCESEINEDARQKLFVTMNKYFEDYNIPLKQKVVLKLLSLCLPFFYLENFNKYLACAKDFFNKNKSVKLFFATCTYCRETQPFMLTYGQTIGKKVMTEQHGGNYGISCGIYNMLEILTTKCCQ